MPLSLPAIVKAGRRTVSRPISVCFVIDKLRRAGTETQLLSLIRDLDRRKVRPSLCLLHPEDAESRSLRPADCPAIALGVNRLVSPAALRGSIRLAAFWRKHRVDVVQTYFKDSTYFAAPLARLCGICQVVRVRNNVGYWLTPTHRLMGKIIGRLGTTLTNSEDAKSAIIDAECMNPRHVTVIANGVDLDRFPRCVPPGTSCESANVGAIANLRAVKNVEGLVRVAAAICRSNPSVQFHVAGEGEERVSLQRAIDAAGLSERFHLHGSVGDVPHFLASLDVAVLASHSESMSNALLEYMAAGRAIVATDVGANAKLIRDGVDGLIVPVKDDFALQAAIKRLLLDGAFARSCGSSARKRVAAEFSRERMVRQFEEFYSSLMEQSGPQDFSGP